MKIKFLKDYRFIGNDPDDGSDTTVKTGSVIDLENDESTQWLIDNGFAEEVKDNRQLFSVASLDRISSMVNVLFQPSQADDGTAQEFVDYLNAVKVVSNDAGFMTRGSDRVGWAICLKDDGKLGTTVTSYELAGAFCFEWGSDAEASIKNHPSEWETIAKYKWGK